MLATYSLFLQGSGTICAETNDFLFVSQTSLWPELNVLVARAIGAFESGKMELLHIGRFSDNLYKQKKRAQLRTRFWYIGFIIPIIRAEDQQQPMPYQLR